MSDLETVFKAVREDYMSAFVPSGACPDQYVADLSGAPGEVVFNRRPVAELPAGLAPVVLILETPHTEEYLDVGHPLPANGTTGKNIGHHLARVMANIPGAAAIIYPRPLVLMNAVQFQCSLGGYRGECVPTKHHRYDVFRLMWDNETIRGDFRARLTQYTGLHQPFSTAYRAGFIVINACTTAIKSTAKQDYRRQLRVMVEDKGVVPALGRPSHRHVRHPSYWLPNQPISTWRYRPEA